MRSILECLTDAAFFVRVTSPGDVVVHLQTGEAFLAVLTTRASQRIDACHESKFNVPAPSARLTKEVRLVYIMDRDQRICAASRAFLEKPPTRPRFRLRRFTRGACAGAEVCRTTPLF